MNWVVHLARLGRQSYSRRFRGDDVRDGGVIVLVCYSKAGIVIHRACVCVEVTVNTTTDDMVLFGFVV